MGLGSCHKLMRNYWSGQISIKHSRVFFSPFVLLNLVPPVVPSRQPFAIGILVPTAMVNQSVPFLSFLCVITLNILSHLIHVWLKFLHSVGCR